MPVFKNEGNGAWYVMARYVNWKGERKQEHLADKGAYHSDEDSSVLWKNED